MSNVKDQLHELLVESAMDLLDAVDIMNDGPDESDEAMAQGRLQRAHDKAKEWRRLYKDTYSEYPQRP